jgi:hypothetical protein
MTDQERQAALMSALTTEHFVLQNASASTISEAAARSSLYLLSLSSSLIAMGFTAQSAVFLPLVACVLPVLFLLGVFTVLRLVDTVLENMQYLCGIARIRAYYRRLTPDAPAYFGANLGRWPEASAPPSQHLGKFASFFGTTAAMVAIVNSFVAGAGIAIVANVLDEGNKPLALSCGGLTVVLLILLFLAYQRWRFRTVALAWPPGPPEPP